MNDAAPDVAGPGWVRCPCGVTALRTTHHSAGGTLSAQCCYCGGTIESWVNPDGDDAA